MNADGYEWDEPAAAAEPMTSTAEEPELQPLAYPNLPAWVEGLLSPMYRRQVDGRATTWCPEWWNHAEAITRLEAIWRAWEHLRLDPATGISVWFTAHADPNMAVLLDPAGPFTGCTGDRGHRPNNLPELPHNTPPPGLFEWSRIRPTRIADYPDNEGPGRAAKPRRIAALVLHCCRFAMRRD